MVVHSGAHTVKRSLVSPISCTNDVETASSGSSLDHGNQSKQKPPRNLDDCKSSIVGKALQAKRIPNSTTNVDTGLRPGKALMSADMHSTRAAIFPRT